MQIPGILSYKHFSKIIILKILQIIQRPQLRGAEIFACQLASELNKRGHQTDMVFVFGNEEQNLPFDLTFHHLQGNEKKRWWDFKGYSALNNLIRKGEYDIIQANAGDTLKYAALSKTLFGWKNKLVFRNANKIGDFLRPGLQKFTNSFLFKKVDFVASVSEECRIDFIKSFQFNGEHVATLPIGVNACSPSKYSSLRDVDIQGAGPYFLHVGGFVPEKNHEGLLRIFKNLLEKSPQAKLILIGEGKLKDKLQATVTGSSLEDAVLFLGKRNDVTSIMQHCNALLLPSLIEGLPGVILEAFSCKLPVIAYNVGGIKEVVHNCKTGWLVEKNDEEGFAVAVNECLSINNNPIKESALRLANEEYRMDIIADKFLTAYNRL